MCLQNILEVLVKTHTKIGWQKTLTTTLDEEKKGYVVLMPDKPSARGHVVTRTNQGSRIDYITEKRYLRHQLGVPRAPISGLLAAIS